MERSCARLGRLVLVALLLSFLTGCLGSLQVVGADSSKAVNTNLKQMEPWITDYLDKDSNTNPTLIKSRKLLLKTTIEASDGVLEQISEVGK